MITFYRKVLLHTHLTLGNCFTSLIPIYLFSTSYFYHARRTAFFVDFEIEADCNQICSCILSPKIVQDFTNHSVKNLFVCCLWLFDHSHLTRNRHSFKGVKKFGCTLAFIVASWPFQPHRYLTLK